MEIELNEIILDKILDKKDKSVISNFKEYRDYNTIRRSLRDAYNLINSTIELQNNIMNEENGLQKHFDELPATKAYFYNAIILYARWFMNTNDKPKLEKDDYFKEDNKGFLETHNYIMKLRNKYIAHNEKDLLGGDKVFLCIDNLNDVKINSKWQETVFPAKETQEKIRKCIEIVHNAIDSKVIPEYEACLIKDIKEKSIIDKLIK